MALTQVYNSKSKKWVLLDDAVKGGIKKMAAEPFEGVPVKGETPAEPEPEKTQNQGSETPIIDEKVESDSKPDNESDSGGDSSGGGWLSALGF